ncbi:Mitotic spindle-associated MMXD complex subunit MIP18 [Mitosporidium daphniae]
MFLENESPQIKESLIPELDYSLIPDAYNDDVQDEFLVFEVFDFIRNIRDPEHPLSLEQLNVVSMSDILILNEDSYRMVKVLVTPTIPHCSMATLIGLCVIVKLQFSLSPYYKISVEIKKGTHQSDEAINKQLNDKERVAAALENSHLFRIVKQCIYPSPPPPSSPSSVSSCCK